MTAPPGGSRGTPGREASTTPWRAVRELVAPWRRRVVVAALTLAGLLVFAQLVGVQVAIGVFAGLVLLTFSLGWFLVDHQGGVHQVLWPMSDRYRTQGFRGSDFRTVNLVNRLRDAAGGTGREDLVTDLHERLRRIIEQRLQATHGITMDEEPDWARSVMPPLLWQLMTGPPPDDLHSPRRLDPILSAIEQW